MKHKSLAWIYGALIGALTGFAMYYLEGYVIASIGVVGGYQHVPEEFKAMIVRRSVLLGFVPGMIVGLWCIYESAKQNWDYGNFWEYGSFPIGLLSPLVVFVITLITLFHYPNNELSRQKFAVVIFGGIFIIIGCGGLGLAINLLANSIVKKIG
ncbi:MAG: hypothetical protein WC460_02985 [Patescibacteria group bacterium]